MLISTDRLIEELFSVSKIVSTTEAYEFLKLYGTAKCSNMLITTSKDVAKSFTLTATDFDGNPQTWTIVTTLTHGTLTGIAPTLTYTPDPNYIGSDSFTFKVNDGTVDSNIATVTITVTPVNDAPIAVDDAYSLDEDTVLVIAAPSVLTNDTDVECGPLTSVLVTVVSNGTLTLMVDGSFTYKPDSNFFGTETFTYVANDGADDYIVAIVIITVVDMPESHYLFLPVILK